MATPLACKIDESDGIVALIVTGEIDLSNIDAFLEAMTEAVSSVPESSKPLRVDLSGVDYLDSGAISALFSHADRICVAANPILLPVLKISGLTSIVEVTAAT
jgi:anti-anti-sigma factor